MQAPIINHSKLHSNVSCMTCRSTNQFQWLSTKGFMLHIRYEIWKTSNQLLCIHGKASVQAWWRSCLKKITAPAPISQMKSITAAIMELWCSGPCCWRLTIVHPGCRPQCHPSTDCNIRSSACNINISSMRTRCIESVLKGHRHC